MKLKSKPKWKWFVRGSQGPKYHGPSPTKWKATLNDRLTTGYDSPLPKPEAGCIYVPTERQVKIAIQRCDNQKAPGTDKTKPWHYIGMETSIVEMFRRAAKEGSFPTQFNCSKAHPLHKKGDLTDPDNYRLIAITNALLKIYEKVVLHVFRK